LHLTHQAERIARAAGRVGGVGYTPLRGCGQVNPMLAGFALVATCQF